MDTTTMLAQLIGPVILILGVSYLVKTESYAEIIKRLKKSTDFLFVWSVVELTSGLAIILNHNLWNNLPEVLVSLIGWGLVIEGTMIMLTNKVSLKKLSKFADLTWLRFGGVIGIMYGAYLTYFGYFM